MRTDPDNPVRSALFTDLYELAMARAYDAGAMEERAVFELFFRELPPERNYVISCGLEDALAFLEGMHFSESDLEYVRNLGLFDDLFVDRLRGLRFTGDVFAVPEGTVIFPSEPALQIDAPIIEAQLAETYLINQIHFQSMIATKASRIVTAADGRDLVEFGARRAHGTDAALKAARASYIAGFQGTSNLLAGKRYGIPVFGTMAHSYIQAHDRELDSFRNFARCFPETTLLVDTYDILDGIHNVISLAREMGDDFSVRAIRIDSGDLGAAAVAARRLLDEAGLRSVKILASGDLDETAIQALAGAGGSGDASGGSGAPIDAFGVGTRLVTSEDSPTLEFVYKLAEYAGRPRRKLSRNKATIPGRKQVFRRVRNGRLAGDVIGLHSETLEGERLLVPVMQNGKRVHAGAEELERVRERARREIERLPADIRALRKADHPYPVNLSDLIAATR
jgi:nicotinate phosphoribosyltransferase